MPDDTAAPKGRTDAEYSLWVALYDQPGTSATQLALAAGIGKSTAQKILARWVGDGSVTRTAGIAEGARRAADLWSITPVAADAADPADPAPQQDATTGPADPNPADADAGEDAEDNATTAAPTASASHDTADATDATVDAPPGDARAATGDAAREATDPAASAPVSAGATAPADSASTDAAGTASGEGASARLAPGGLRGMVEDHLRDHPGEQFGPTAIAKALGGKSSGAVSNALDRLVAQGTAMKTQDKPRRFALAPTEQADAAAPAS